MDTINWWITLLLAIPIGILTNLLTPKVQKILDERIKRRSTTARKQILEEYKMIQSFHQNRNMFSEYLFSMLFKAIYLLALGVSTVVVFFILSTITAPHTHIPVFKSGDYALNFDLDRVFSIIGFAFGFVIASTVAKLSSNVLVIRNKLNSFSEYEESIKKYIN